MSHWITSGRTVKDYRTNVRCIVTEVNGIPTEPGMPLQKDYKLFSSEKEN